MGCADIATVLLPASQFDAKSRTGPTATASSCRPVGSMLLYSLLYLTGYEDITLLRFRFPPARFAHNRPPQIRPLPPASRRPPVRFSQGM